MQIVHKFCCDKIYLEERNDKKREKEKDETFDFINSWAELHNLFECLLLKRRQRSFREGKTEQQEMNIIVNFKANSRETFIVVKERKRVVKCFYDNDNFSVLLMLCVSSLLAAAP